MKRFYDNADAKRTSDGWAIALDDRPVKTPGRKPLAVPARKLADAIAAEWAGQEEKIDPAAMPLTGFANAAIDRVAPHRADFAAELAQYGETDLLCYRADSPAELVANQCAAWDPLLDWAQKRFDIGFETTTGIVHRPQPDATVERLKAATEAFGPFHLAGLSPLVRIGGSLVAALALAENAFDEDTVWTATRIDEDWQAGQWGEDEEAIAARDARRREFSAGMRFLRLLEG
ncbi:ATPase [Parasphingopyxis algicola]|uniref:ATP12 family chaperone protein n=1 Tax=Parasphingopyxis algicola TaxID=2026624 RepID=UPI0015A3756E|nr:ATP12 family protein [Parasphingopyxis algicola]QLC25797.1 ATPase [Parasphingopyxis algicola]